MRYLVVCLTFITLFGCHSGGNSTSANKKADSLTKPKPIDSITKTHDTAKSVMVNEEVDPDTAFSRHAMEMISGLPEISAATSYIDSASNHRRKFIMVLQGFPDSNTPYYSINAGEQSAIDDSDDHFVTYMHFNIYKKADKQPLIKYYSTIEDKEISLDEWRKKEDSLKKSGKKTWFFVY